LFFFFNDTATTEIYTLSLHDALPICARLQKRFAAPQRLVEAERRASVGPRDDQKVLRRSRLGSHLDPPRGVLDRNDTAPRRVAAFLGIFLVLDLDRLRARRLIAADGEIDIEEAAIARVAISNERRNATLSDLTHAADHLCVA